MKFIVTYEISGRATAQVEANSKEEARKKAGALEIIEKSDDLIEWSFEDVKTIEEDV